MSESSGMGILRVFFLGLMLVPLVSPFPQRCGLQVYFQVRSSPAITVSGIFHFLGNVPVIACFLYSTLCAPRSSPSCKIQVLFHLTTLQHPCSHLSFFLPSATFSFSSGLTHNFRGAASAVHESPFSCVRGSMMTEQTWYPEA